VQAAEVPGLKFLYAGLYAGWTPTLWVPLWGSEDIELDMAGFSAAATVDLRLFNLWLNHFLGVQFEGVATWDSRGVSLEIPAMLRFTALDSGGGAYFSLLAGAYLFAPPSKPAGFRFGHESENVLWGFKAGFGVGRKLGPGYLNLGLRWSGDMFAVMRTASGDFHNGNSLTAQVGYELGFLRRPGAGR
jgi:hypothetical protein